MFPLARLLLYWGGKRDVDNADTINTASTYLLIFLIFFVLLIIYSSSKRYGHQRVLNGRYQRRRALCRTLRIVISGMYFCCHSLLSVWLRQIKSFRGFVLTVAGWQVSFYFRYCDFCVMTCSTCASGFEEHIFYRVPVTLVTGHPILWMRLQVRYLRHSAKEGPL